jgi:hypothetical protein
MPMMTDKYDAKESKKNLNMLLKMYKKTLLDGNFQRWGGISRGSGWTVKNGKSFIENFIHGATFNNVINVEVESSLKYVKEINDTKSIAYFQDVQSRGYKYVSIDGNNTASYLTAFIQDHEDLKINHVDYSNKIRFSALTEDDQEEIKYSEKINVIILRRITLDEMCDLFRNLNMQTRLNAQEWRQARWSPLSQQIRQYGENMKTVFTYFVYSNEQDLDKRSHEELIAALAMKIENNHNNPALTKKWLDSFYENTESLNSKTIAALDEVFSVCDKMRRSLSGPFQKKLSKGQMQNLFEFIHILVIDKGYSITKDNYDQVLDWFLQKDSEFREISAKVASEDLTDKSYLHWTNNWSHKFSWINVRKLMESVIEQEINSFISKGTLKRKRTPKDRFTFDEKRRLLELQKSRTRSGDSIAILDLYLGKYEADHVISIHDGGETIIENAELMTIEENRKKGPHSNEPHFDFQHPPA